MKRTIRKVLIIYTGGTIGMKSSEKGYTPVAGFLKDVLKNSSVLHNPKVKNNTNLQFVLPESKVKGNHVFYDLIEYSPLLDSSCISMNDWSKIAKDIYKYYDLYDSFIVLHGTDTMAFTASALSFMLEGLLKTVILTGSQIPISELRNDGIDNLLGALLVAGNYDIPEVCVYFNNHLLRGNRVTKVSATEFDAFQSGNYPSLIKIGVEAMVNWTAVRSSSVSTEFSIQEKMSSQIATLQLFPGITPDLVRNFAKSSIKGIVLRTYGSGNAPTNPQFLKALKNLSDSGVIIVNCTQCFQGKVKGHYEAGQLLAEAGVVSGADMTIEAALTKLSYLLAKNLPVEQIRHLITQDLRGELTEEKQTKFSFKDKTFIKSVAAVLNEDSGEVKAALEPILLCACANLGDLEQIKAMHNNGANLESADYDGRTALHLAASEGHLHIINDLVAQNINLNPVDRWGGTPVQDALRHGHHHIAEILLPLIKR